MFKAENHCVECGLYCLGNGCANRNIKTFYCDRCKNDGAEYRIEGKDYCEECAGDYMQEAFDELTISEKAHLLDIKLQRTKDI